MTSFSQDKKWMEAKTVIGKPDWLEVVSYYRFIDGSNVFVYVIGDGDKQLIVDFIDDENILLINKKGLPVVDTYTNVLKGRKLFSYSEHFEEKEFKINEKEFKIPIET